METDRLLEYVINRDIISVIMNSVYKDVINVAVVDHISENEKLRHEIEILGNKDDDVKKHFQKKSFNLKNVLNGARPKVFVINWPCNNKKKMILRKLSLNF